MNRQVVTGVDQGIFDIVHFLRGGTLQELNTVLDNLSIGAGGGTNFTPSAPLSLSGGVLSINLSSYATVLALSNALAAYTDTTNLTALLASKISTSHEANKLALADVDHSGFDITAGSLSLKTAQGVTVIITADNGGNLSIGSAGIVTVPYLTPLLTNKANSSQVLTDVPSGALFTDTLYTHPSQHSMSMITGLTAALNLKANSSQVLTNVPSGALFTDTLYTHPSQHSMSMITGLTAALASKQATLTTGAGAFLASNVVSGYDLRWLTNGVPTIGGGIRCLHFKSGFAISETLNIGSGQNQLDITATGVTDAAMKTHISNSVYATAGSGITSAGNPSTGIVYFGLDTSIVCTRSQVTADIAAASHTISDTTGLQAALDSKVDDTQVLTNVPAGMPFTSLVASLAKISRLSNGPSAISLGTGTGPDARCAIYEIENAGGSYPQGSFFYGHGLFEGGSNALGTGVGFWGGSGVVVPNQSGSAGAGTLPHMLLATTGYLGIGHRNPQQMLHVDGNALISGSLTASSKSFLIDHPDPVKEALGYKLRHWTVETADCPGGLVQYRRTIDMISTTQSFQMQDWFSHLVKEVTVHVNPFEHFGSAWGRCEGDTITLHATTLGKWHVLVVASRADDCAENHCEQEVEFIPTPPEEGSPAFP